MEPRLDGAAGYSATHEREQEHEGSLPRRAVPRSPYAQAFRGRGPAREESEGSSRQRHYGEAGASALPGPRQSVRLENAGQTSVSTPDQLRTQLRSPLSSDVLVSGKDDAPPSRMH